MESKRWYWWTYLQGSTGDADIENRIMDMCGGEEGESEGEGRSVVSDSLRPHPGQKTAMVSLSFLQGIFPTQGLNPGFPHCRRILYQMSHKGSPRILEYVAYPFSSKSSQPSHRTRISCIAGRFFTNWVMRETQIRWMERAAWKHIQYHMQIRYLMENFCMT